MFGLGTLELIFIFLVILLLFGPKALPGIVKGFAEAIRTIKKEFHQVSKNFHEVDSNTQNDTNATSEKLPPMDWEESGGDEDTVGKKESKNG